MRKKRSESPPDVFCQSTLTERYGTSRLGKAISQEGLTVEDVQHATYIKMVSIYHTTLTEGFDPGVGGAALTEGEPRLNFASSDFVWVSVRVGRLRYTGNSLVHEHGSDFRTHRNRFAPQLPLQHPIKVALPLESVLA